MFEFEEIYRLVNAGRRLPEFASAEERMAYFELAGISDRYGKRIITKNEATAQKADAKKRFEELRKAGQFNLDAYSAYAKNIKAAEMELTELIKKINPDADFAVLLYEALGIISMFEGQSVSVEQRVFEKNMKESA